MGKKSALVGRFVGHPGIEWTTYFGHMLVIGSEADARLAQKSRTGYNRFPHQRNQVAALWALHILFDWQSDLLPVAVENFELKDYDNIDFIELWNRVNPDESFGADWRTKCGRIC